MIGIAEKRLEHLIEKRSVGRWIPLDRRNEVNFHCRSQDLVQRMMRLLHKIDVVLDHDHCHCHRLSLLEALLPRKIRCFADWHIHICCFHYEDPSGVRAWLIGRRVMGVRIPHTIRYQ